MGVASGLTASITLKVEEGDTALAIGSGDVTVLATPRLVTLVEQMGSPEVLEAARREYIATLTGRELADVRRSMGFLFQNSARMEVSGIRQGDTKEVDARVKRKIKQAEQSKDTQLPVVVIVVEFGAPAASMVML